MRFHQTRQSGFSLVEMLIYIGVFVIVAGVFVGILTNVVRINTQESSGAEVASQLNSAMTTISRLIRESSNIEIDAGATTSTLKLRMRDPAKDPVCIYVSGGIVKLAQGGNSSNCSANPANISDISTSRVSASVLNFKKLTFYPGHDQVVIDLQMAYNSSNPQAAVSRILHSAVSRVSAATFDSNLLPGTDNVYQIGFPVNQRWKDMYIANSINDNIYFSGTNIGIGTSNPQGVLHISTASSTNTLMVLNNGNIGIGTSTPLSPLHVKGSSMPIGVGPGFVTQLLDSANGNSYTQQMFMVNGSYRSLLQADSNGLFSIYTKGSGSQVQAVNIDASGNVGIGTTNPTATLDVNGPVKVGGSETGDSTKDIKAYIQKVACQARRGTWVDNSGCQEYAYFTVQTTWNINACAAGYHVCTFPDLFMGGFASLKRPGYSNPAAYAWVAGSYTGASDSFFYPWGYGNALTCNAGSHYMMDMSSGIGYTAWGCYYDTYTSVSAACCRN